MVAVATQESDLLPESGNLIGALGVVLKWDIEVSGATGPEKEALIENLAKIKTRGEAEAYAKSVLAKIEYAKASGTLPAPPTPGEVAYMICPGRRKAGREASSGADRT